MKYCINGWELKNVLTSLVFEQEAKVTDYSCVAKHFVFLCRPLYVYTCMYAFLF